MTDLGAYVVELIADAKLVVAYGARTGRLPDDTLMAAVAAAEAALAANRPGEVRLKELAAALNRGVQVIAPVTLLDLGSTWRPYPDTRARRIGRVAFAFFAVLLILAAGYYTQIYTQANAILGQLTDIQSRNVHDKSERLFRFFVENHKTLLALDTRANDALVFEPYLHSYEDLLALNDQIATYVPLSDDLVSRSTNVPLLSPLAHGIGKLLGLVDSAGGERNPSGNPLIRSYLGRSDYKGPDGGPASQAGANAAPALPTTAAPPAGTAPVAAVPKAETDTDQAMEERDVGLNMLSKKQALLEQFLFMSGIDASIFTSTLSVQIYECQRMLTLLGFWVLPALYGLLGATVFQMRAILNPLVPLPSPERLFLRLALGGFAGISIFLVFGPAPQKIFEGSSSVIGSFGLAFLFGFSIDVFFTILDRLVGMVSQSVTQTGK